MESSELAAFCNQANVPAVMLAVAIVDRLRGDQVRSQSMVARGHGIVARVVARCASPIPHRQVTLSHEELDKCEASVIDAAWAFVSTRI